MARLHDLGDNSSAALDLYEARLKNVTAVLTAAGAAKRVVYALTTPQMQFEAGLLIQGVPGVPPDPLAPHRGPLGPSLDRGSAIGNAPALVSGPLA